MDYGYEGQHFQLMIVLLLLVTNDGMDYGLEVVSIITLASLLSLRASLLAINGRSAHRECMYFSGSPEFPMSKFGQSQDPASCFAFVLLQRYLTPPRSTSRTEQTESQYLRKKACNHLGAHHASE